MKYKKTVLIFLTIFELFGCSETPTENGYKPPTIEKPAYPCSYKEPSVTFDGKKIVFKRHKVIKVDRNGYHNIYDPDSTGFWLCNIDGSKMKLIYQNSTDIISNPQFTPDMQYLVFVKNSQICRAKYNGGLIKEEDIELLTTEGRNFFPSVSPDGEWIAYGKSICEGPKTCGVFVMNRNGENKRFISEYSSMPDWHPSGQKIFFFNRAILEGGEVIGDSLFEYDIITNERKLIIQLTGINFDNRYPKYSPDGTLIAYSSQPKGGLPQLWLLDLSNNENRKLTTNGIKGNCSWTPNGKIVYTHYAPYNYDINNGTLWIMDSDGGNKKQLTFNYGLILE